MHTGIVKALVSVIYTIKYFSELFFTKIHFFHLNHYVYGIIFANVPKMNSVIISFNIATSIKFTTFYIKL